MRVLWTEQAQEDLERIYQFWCVIDAGYARRLYNAFLDEAEVLSRFPWSCARERFLLHRPEGFRSLIVRKYYKLVYTVERGEEVVVHAVWDCRQDPEELVRGF